MGLDVFQSTSNYDSRSLNFQATEISSTRILQIGEQREPPSVKEPELKLDFSDELNTDGRTFYPGGDPFCEAVDLQHLQTGNLEWYDPAAITTKDRVLKITLSQKENHDLNYQGGMITSWNRFCFTGGYIEVMVTGLNAVAGLWPAVWASGELSIVLAWREWCVSRSIRAESRASLIRHL